MNRLSVEDQWFIHQLFWEKQTNAALRRDYRFRSNASADAKRAFCDSFVEFKRPVISLGVSWALLDSLDLLPGIDLL